jgi:hypothetical protein
MQETEQEYILPETERNIILVLIVLVLMRMQHLCMKQSYMNMIRVGIALINE